MHPFFESLLGPSWFSIFHEFMAYLKEQIVITALTICKDVVSKARNQLYGMKLLAYTLINLRGFCGA